MTKEEMQEMLAEFLDRDLEKIQKNKTLKKDYKPFFEKTTLKEKWLAGVEILRELEIDFQTGFREEVCESDWKKYMNLKESDEFYEYVWNRALEEMKKEVE
ncbi:MAG: hypothetical protein ACLFUH_04585 [Bacteroidales bacterium]